MLGIAKRPKYRVPHKNAAAATRQIIDWWMQRWVLKRIGRDDVLERMSRHTLVHPIRHGARVPRWDAEQRVLFEED